MNQHGPRLVSNFLEYHFGGFRFIVSRYKLQDGTEKLNLSAHPPENKDFKFIKNEQVNLPFLFGSLTTHLFPSEAKTYYKNAYFLNLFEAEYESMMNSIHYIGPLCEYPRREYTWSGASPSEVGSRGERTIEAILSATLTEDTANPEKPSLQAKIAHWLKELKLIHEFSVKEIAPGTNLYRAMVRRDPESPETLLTEVGFGVSQILPALVQLHYVPEGSTVLMEQPEIHLHPSVQSGLADVIMSVAKERNLHVIVENHSEHMLRRFQRRVAENTYPADEIKLYFCENIEGESRLVDLQLDEYGEILNWPPDFFGEEMAEIAATRKAILRRKMEAARA